MPRGAGGMGCIQKSRTENVTVFCPAFFVQKNAIEKSYLFIDNF
jgi:hypothetical protein